MGQAFRKLFDSIFGNREMRVSPQNLLPLCGLRGRADGQFPPSASDAACRESSRLHIVLGLRLSEAPWGCNDADVVTRA